MGDMDSTIQQLTDAAIAKGRVIEQNRVLEILIRYKEAGWIDPALALLLAEDIGVQISIGNE
jgi:hypothetical protein